MKKQQKRKGFEWYRMLTKKQQKQFRKNIPCKYFMLHMNYVDTFFVFMLSAFPWDSTPQGGKYWNRIANLDK